MECYTYPIPQMLCGQHCPPPLMPQGLMVNFTDGRIAELPILEKWIRLQREIDSFRKFRLSVRKVCV